VPASLAVFLVAFLAAAVSALAWPRILGGPAWTDLPRADRHRRQPVSRAGGPAWLTGALAGILLAALLRAPRELATAGSQAARHPLSWTLASLVAGSLLLAAGLGRSDDSGRMGAGRKWILQSALLLALAAAWGLLRDARGPAPVRGVPGGTAGAVVLAVAVALWARTALEIFDNLDGALAGVSACGLAAAALAAHDPALAACAFAGCGASLGFLLHNRPPARIFLGNMGSQPVGLLTSFVLLALLGSGGAGPARHGTRPGIPWADWAVLLPLLWPMGDLLYVTASRVRRGVVPWKGGCDHSAHLLSRRLGSDRKAAAVILSVSLAALAVSRILHAWPAFLIRGR
jgi:UDP-GlcNAc:undecaprenyl-phosphate GlcNAc-1-phosphate transferase